jgi:hypothetical protein
VADATRLGNAFFVVPVVDVEVDADEVGSGVEVVGLWPADGGAVGSDFSCISPGVIGGRGFLSPMLLSCVVIV